MNDWQRGEMPDEVRLSPRERLALLRIEADLRQDPRFVRRMGAARHGVWLPVSVVLLAVASVFVAVMGVRTSDPALMWCFMLVWPLTLVQAFRLLCRAVRSRPCPGARLTRWL
ncbi:DUF3040 domain-containing protein [Streptomyces naphthomycinicus]|uniref:DUF3040 domain-containing protein n=1 Tax=Streptomyces naphthomycinicus TaxID=2872625 RepID=UPI001CEC8B63|nr:DUF3040 domain-containing protein [Streptomyces sp. TML10]